MKILVISHFCPPLNKVPSQRIYQLCKEWKRSGAEVTLLTTKKYVFDGQHGYDVDMEDAFDKIYELNYHKFLLNILPTKLLRNPTKNPNPNVTISSNSKAATSPIKVALTNVKSNLLALFDFNNLRLIGKRNEIITIINEVQPSVIFSSYSPQWSHRVARLAKTNNRHIPWFAEFRDLWAFNHAKQNHKLVKNIALLQEKSVVKQADVLVTVTKSWSETLERIHTKPTICVYNGFDRSELVHVTPKTGDSTDAYERSTHNIVFAGTMYEDYDFDGLFKALSRFCFDGIPAVKINIYGRGTESLLKTVKDNKVESFVTIHGLVDRQSCIKAMQESDSLLLFQFSNPEGEDHIPAKVFDYMSVQKPIILRSYHPNSELVAIVTRTSETAMITNNTDYDNFFASLISPNISSFDGSFDSASISEFDRKASAKRLFQHFSTACETPENARPT